MRLEIVVIKRGAISAPMVRASAKHSKSGEGEVIVPVANHFACKLSL